MLLLLLISLLSLTVCILLFPPSISSQSLYFLTLYAYVPIFYLSSCNKSYLLCTPPLLLHPPCFSASYSPPFLLSLYSFLSLIPLCLILCFPRLPLVASISSSSSCPLTFNFFSSSSPFSHLHPLYLFSSSSVLFNSSCHSILFLRLLLFFLLLLSFFPSAALLHLSSPRSRPFPSH